MVSKLFGVIRSKLVLIEIFLIPIIPCLFLLDFSHYYSAADWFLHTWEMAYMGAYFRDSLTFTPVLHTNAIIGHAGPIFYGFWFYSLFGFLCTFLHPHTAIAIGAYILYVVQYATLRLLLLRLNLPAWFASMVAVMVTLAIYPLTNLYNRGALTEFFATGAFTIAIITLLLATLDTKPTQRMWFAVSLAAFAFLAVTHPITLLNSGLFMGVLCPLILWIYDGHGCSRGQMLVYMLVIPLVLSLVLAPWLYAQYQLGGEIFIAKYIMFSQTPDTVDSIWTRLFPLPVDTRLWSASRSQTIIPYLDAPINVFVFVTGLLFSLYVAKRAGFFSRPLLVAFVSLCLAGFILWCSVSPYAWDQVLPYAYRIIQFPFRLTTYINLALLCVILLPALTLKYKQLSVALPLWTKTAMVVLCTAACCAFLQKTVHVASYRSPVQDSLLADATYRHNLLPSMSGFYYLMDFNTPDLFPPQHDPMVGNIALSVSKKPFGHVPPIHMVADTAGWYKTNIYAFPWNKVWVDNVVAVPRIVRGAGDMLSVYLTPGIHTITYKFIPPRLWTWLTYVALFACIGIINYLIYAVGTTFLLRRERL